MVQAGGHRPDIPGLLDAGDRRHTLCPAKEGRAGTPTRPHLSEPSGVHRIDGLEGLGRAGYHNGAARGARSHVW